MLPLTADLCRTLERSASEALNGKSRTCALEEMDISCFASEYCALGRPPSMQLSDLYGQRHAFAAVADVDTDGYRGLTDNRFVGCVSAAPPHDVLLVEFPFLCPKCLIISNLCVAEAYRRLGAGRQLLQRILELQEENVYLLVIRSADGLGTPMPGAAEALGRRVTRLLTTYKKVSFHPVASSKSMHLLRYIPDVSEQKL